MSTKSIPVPTATIVCDLCGKPMDTYTNRDRCNLRWGFGGQQLRNRPSWYYFARLRNVTRGSGAPDGDNRYWEWDFHGECLVSALQPLIDREVSE